MNKSILLLLLFGFCFAKTTVDFASKYDEVYHLVDDKYRVKKNNSYGMVNSKNKVLIPIKYEGIYTMYNTTPKMFTAIEKDFPLPSRVLYDEKGKLIISSSKKYVDILSFEKQTFKVRKKDGSYGVVSKSGKILVPIRYKKINLPDIWHKQRMFKVHTFDGKVGLYLLEKQIFPAIYDDLELIKNTDEYFIFKKDGIKTIMNKKAKILIEDFDAYNLIKKDLLAVKKGKYWAIINKFGKIIVPYNYDEIKLNIGEYIEVKKDGKFGLLNQDGKIVLPVVYDNIFSAGDRYLELQQNGKYGLANKDGKIILKPDKYDYMFSFVSEDEVIVGTKNKIGIIDVYGKVVLPFRSDIDLIYKFRANNDYYEVTRGRKRGLMDKKGKIIIPVKYEMMYALNSNLIVAYKKYARWDKTKNAVLINLKENKIIPTNYSRIELFTKDLLVAIDVNNHKKVFLDELGNIVVPKSDNRK